MQLEQVAKALKELGHPTRLCIYQLVVRAGHKGTPVVIYNRNWTFQALPFPTTFLTLLRLILSSSVARVVPFSVSLSTKTCKRLSISYKKSAV